MRRKKSLQEKGITLIALVVTIIILLILAGVTLNIALSDGGLFSKTQEAADKYKQAQSDEEEEIEKIKYAAEGIYITDIEEISSVEEFKKVSQKVNEGDSLEGTLIKLTGDVDLSGENWTPIGSERNPFKGAFDGGGHKITNLTINTSNECQGLFGYNAGTIQNVGIESGTLTVGPKSGGIAGCNTGTIENCYNKASIKSENLIDDGVGGIVGRCGALSKISKCFNSGNITVTVTDNNSGTRPGAGGVAGKKLDDSSTDIIEFCYNTGNISVICKSGSYATAAGITTADLCRVDSCYNVGSVSVTSEDKGTINIIGGIKAFSSEGGSIIKCYNIGEISGSGGKSSRIGGIVGWSNGGTVKNCIWTRPDKDDYHGGKDNTKEADESNNKKELDSRKDEWVSTLGGNFLNDTDAINNGYPILLWQKK